LGTDSTADGIWVEEEGSMNTVFRGLAVALGFALIQACGGNATASDTPVAPLGDAPRGYGEPTEDQVAGAVASLEPEEESGSSFSTMVEMLRGRVTGLQVEEGPGGEISIRIRGDQSIYFNGEPLLVVDGVSIPAYGFSSTLRTMNPSDVRSIRVLKDLGSTSAYGTRGAHGVILISLKRR
jgi:TonB-dependent SusC/RagA subfamily outer membrane receptor